MFFQNLGRFFSGVFSGLGRFLRFFVTVVLPRVGSFLLTVGRGILTGLGWLWRSVLVPFYVFLGGRLVLQVVVLAGAVLLLFMIPPLRGWLLSVMAESLDTMAHFQLWVQLVSNTLSLEFGFQEMAISSIGGILKMILQSIFDTLFLGVVVQFLQRALGAAYAPIATVAGVIFGLMMLSVVHALLGPLLSTVVLLVIGILLISGVRPGWPKVEFRSIISMIPGVISAGMGTGYLAMLRVIATMEMSFSKVIKGLSLVVCYILVVWLMAVWDNSINPKKS